jgi:hypothetical protein
VHLISKLFALAGLTAVTGLVTVSAASGTMPRRWAGLTRAYVESVGLIGDSDYQLNDHNGVRPFHTLSARRYGGHPAWRIRWSTSCAGGHVPTVYLWRAKRRFRSTQYDFVCSALRGEHVACKEPVTC